MKNPEKWEESQHSEIKKEAPDFRKIFSERLAEIEPLKDEEAINLASWYADTGIKGIRKEVPAIIFRSGKDERSPLDNIWIENSNVTEKERVSFVHNRISKDLADFLEIDGRPDVLSGYMVEDMEGQLHLIVDLQIGSIIRNNQELEDEDYKSILDVMRVYGITDIIEKASKRQERMTKRGVVDYQDRITEALVDQSLIDKRREDLFLINLAQKYSMTNSQYMRLKILHDTLLRSGTQVNLEEIAKSIVDDPEGVGIDVKSSL